MLLAFHKPYGVLSQFTPDGSKNLPLAAFDFPKSVYPLGRLDADSEGLLLLSDERNLNSRLLDPENAHTRIYWTQVDQIPTEKSLRMLENGILLRGRKTLPARARLLHPPPSIPERNPPIRFRKNIPTSWIELELIEGKNHQVRRMTAAIGHPTLRLIRVRIGNLALNGIAPGQWKTLSAQDRRLIFPDF